MTQSPAVGPTAVPWTPGEQGTLDGSDWQHWVGVLQGDVNGSWTPPASSTDLDITDPDYFRILGAQQSAPTDVWGI